MQLAVIVLASIHLGSTHEDPEVPVVVVSPHQLRHHIRKEVTSVVQQATTNITDAIGEVTRKVDWAVIDHIAPLKDEIAEEVNSALKDVITNVTDAVEQILKPVLDEIAQLKLPGKSPSNPAVSCEQAKANDHSAPAGYYWIQNSEVPLVQVYCKMDEIKIGRNPDFPASSCKEIIEVSPSSPSGFYWVKDGNEGSVRVYCDMTRTCGGITGGWMQVANIDMTNSSHTCPQGLNATTHHPIRVCGINVNGGCSSATFDVHGIEYSQVCGKIIGYQDRSPDGFDNNRGIDGVYVDGVSLTHGNNPRKHIWTFAAAASESHNQCPCLSVGTITVPSFVGNDYFCDTGTPAHNNNRFHLDDPLWDGEGCGPTSTCCSFNNPPWFSKQLPSPTTDDIEMRLCANNHHAVYNLGDEDVTIQTVELFVQ